MDESNQAELVDDLDVSVEPMGEVISNAAQATPEELVEKSIAPVKAQFLRPHARSSASHRVDSDSVAKENGNDKTAKSSLVKEKKSKRQLKRERRQEEKSALHICPELAKTGDISSCPYKDKCRFSHDIEAFKAQKPADIGEECPFTSVEEICPYGLACRFSGGHKDGLSNETLVSCRNKSEINGLKKDVQKLLWKNKMSFPKADSKLKDLGLMDKSKLKVIEQVKKETVVNNCSVSDENGCAVIENDFDIKVELLAEGSAEVSESGLEKTCVFDGPPPLKKSKSCHEEKGFCDQTDDGADSNIVEINKLPSDDDLVEDGALLKLQPREWKLIDFRDKLYLAPLTTVGNLPFRRVCKSLGADVTCGEMAMCTNILQGQASEWALLRRHSSEDLFGVQICGSFPDTVARTVELIDRECTVDFIDINMGCPIDIVVNKGAGSALLTKPMRMKSIVEAASGVMSRPLTIKVRTGYFEGKNRIDSLIAEMSSWGMSAVTIHGRTRQQRYSKLADWDYIYQCANKSSDSLQVIGNGDVFSYIDWNKSRDECPKLSTCMIARGALIKPWLFTEIKEQRHWDISSGERLNILNNFVRFGLQHWGSDTKGVETTRRFLLEWLSYTCRYIPVGLLEIIPQRLNWRPPSYYGRDDLETLMASDSAADWVRISEMLLGKVPDGFTFAPKHKSNAYDRAENG